MQQKISSYEVPDSTAIPWVGIIDDHDSLRFSLARALRIEGIRADCFGSAEEFLQRAMPSAPACLIVDMQLPRMSGHELMHFLERERPPAPPAVFITGHEDLLAALDACCAPYGRLRKPFEIDSLLALVVPLTQAARGVPGR